MKEKRRTLYKVLFIIAIPVFINLVFLYLPTRHQRSLNNIYQEAKKNEVYVYGDSLFQHGVILVNEKDNLESLFKRVKSIKKNYVLQDSFDKNTLPKEFLVNYKINLDDYLVNKKTLIKKKGKNGKNGYKKTKIRRLRYR